MSEPPEGSGVTDKIVSEMPVRNKQKDDKGLFLVPPVKKCSHLRASFILHEDAGKAECKLCGGEVSLLFVLQQLMQQGSIWGRARERYMEEMARLSARSKTKCQHCQKMTKISRN